MINGLMANRTISGTMCGCILQLCHEEDLKSCTTGPYKVITKLSDVTYRIQSLDKKRLCKVVPFDRLKICYLCPTCHSRTSKGSKEQPKNPKHTGKRYGDKLQLEEIDDDTMVQAPLDLDLPARDVLQEDIPPAQELLDHGEDHYLLWIILYSNGMRMTWP